MKHSQYSLSFTTGGLFQQESLMLARRFLDVGDWSQVRAEAVENNTLQVRTKSAAQRISREVIARLKTLSRDELDFLLTANPQDQAYLLWIAVCQCFPFIAEFAQEVLRERFLTLKTTLTHEEFDVYFARKGEWHPEVDAIKPATRKKLRQVLFRMLREAQLIDKAGTILIALPGHELLTRIRDNHPQAVQYLPLASGLKD